MSKQDRELFRVFVRETLSESYFNALLKDSELLLKGSYLYRVNPNLPDLGNLQVVHPGWWLGTIRKGRFEPAHWLALGSKSGDFCYEIELGSEGPEVTTYLRGNILPKEGKDGWVLITTDHFPLGWGKRVKNVVKNFYPHGLRQY